VIHFLHQTFNRLLIPAVVGGLWAYAHLKNTTSRTMTMTWREGNVMRTGNPFTAPVTPVILGSDDRMPKPTAPVITNADADSDVLP
jgi:hypothetical protein